MNDSPISIISKHTSIALVTILAILLAGCGDNNKKELGEYVKQVKARAPNPIEPMPQHKEYPKFSYPNNHSRDPFVAQRPRKAIDGELNARVKQPLEAFPLDSLRMVGTLQKNDKEWALISASDNSIHRVTVADYMGQNYGKITEITPDKVYVEETVSDSTGWRQRPTSLVLVGK